jgi:CBS domain containing-hemolysin-like protein
MKTEVVLIGAIAGAAISFLGSLVSRGLYEFSRYELEQYCRKRHNRARFTEILDQNETVAIRFVCLTVIGGVVFAGFVAKLLLDVDGSPGAEADRVFLMALAAAAIFLVIINIWIVTAIVRLWSAPLLYHSWPLLRFASILISPLTTGVTIADLFFRRIAGRSNEKQDDEEAFEDEIRSMVSVGQREGLIEPNARRMIEGVIELPDVQVSEIMTRLSNVDALRVDLSWPELSHSVGEYGRTRLPVFDESLDQIVGILFVKDLMPELEKPDDARKPLRELVRRAAFVPRTQSVDSLLQEFRRTRNHMAIVIDEFHHTVGVVTIEDALEEIVGEIADEFDEEIEEPIKHLRNDLAEVRGAALVTDVCQRLQVTLPEAEDYDTIGGYMMDRLGRIPRAGDRVEVDGALITVLEATKRRVEKVRIELRAAEKSTTAR